MKDPTIECFYIQVLEDKVQTPCKYQQLTNIPRPPVKEIHTIIVGPYAMEK